MVAQRPEFAVGLRYEHASDRLRSVCLLPERKRQFGQPPLHPIRFDVRKVLTATEIVLQTAQVLQDGQTASKGTREANHKRKAS
jgi:hypothetical protein